MSFEAFFDAEWGALGIEEPDLPPVQPDPEVPPVQPNPTGRALFGVNSNFDANQLSGDEKTWYDQTIAWLANRKGTLDKYAQGLDADNGNVPFEVTFDGEKTRTLGSHKFRYIKPWFFTHLHLLYLYGRSDSLEAMVTMIRKLIDITIDDYPEEAQDSRSGHAQPGVKRWVYMGGAAFTCTDGLEVENETNLVLSFFTMLELALKQNNHTYFSEFSSFVTNHLYLRQVFLGAYDSGNTGKTFAASMPSTFTAALRDQLKTRDYHYHFNKGLRHPDVTRLGFHYFRYLTHGWEIDLAAIQFMQKRIDDYEFVDVQGTEIMLWTHLPLEFHYGPNWRNRPKSDPKMRYEGSQDHTYMEETAPVLNLLNLAGYAGVTDRMLKGYGAVIFKTVIYDWPTKRASTSIGGYNLADTREKYFVVGAKQDGEFTKHETRYVRQSGHAAGFTETLVNIIRGNGSILTYRSGNTTFRDRLKSLANSDGGGTKFSMLLHYATRR